MQLSDFDFELPEELIAQAPLEARDATRLLHVVPDQLYDRLVADLPDLFQSGDVLVLNESKVIPARLFTQVNDREVEVLLHQAISDDALSWSAFARPARKLKKGMVLSFAEGFSATVQGRTDDGQVRLLFCEPDKKTLFEKLHAVGHMPLPPYIKREDNSEDIDRYQTVFAKTEGSVAAPTAGLHFTEKLLDEVRARGVQIAKVTLHVGAGTFQPVKVDNIADHQMHAEWYDVNEDAANTVNQAREKGGKVIAVGTTSLRTLESAADENGLLRAASGDTRLFITPGYRFNIVDRLMTNFHLPKSTLFMLVSAFAGFEKMKQAYQHAIDNRYRFYSYGDACLLERSI